MKKTIIILISITVFCLILLFTFFKIFSIKNINKQNKLDVDISTFNIKNRTKLMCENDLLIGNNIKELENNFFDIKLTIEEKSLVIYLNKLWYSSYDKDYIQSDYLAQICRQISKSLNVSNIEYEYTLYKLIKENFSKVKHGKVKKNVQDEQFEMYLSHFDGMCKLEIKRK